MPQVYGDGTSTATNGANVRVEALRAKAIRVATRELVFDQLADKETMPTQHGKTLKVHKTLWILDDANINDQGLDSTGAVPSAGEPNVNGNLYGSSRSVVDITNGLPMLSEGAGRVNRVGVTRITREGTLVRMGAFLEYTDEVDKFSDAKMEVQYYEKMGTLAAAMYDDYVQKELLGAAGIENYGGTATSILTVTGNSALIASDLTYDLIIDGEDSLKANWAEMSTSIIAGTPKIDTMTVNASYFAYCGSVSTRALMKLKDFHNEAAYTPARMYAAAGNLAKNEVGAVSSTRFIEARRMLKWDGGGAQVTGGVLNANGYKTTTLTAAQATARGHGAVAGTYFDAFPIMYVTKGAFATIGLQGNKKVKWASKKPGDGVATYEDPHNLMGIYSFNFFAGSIVLEPEKILRIVHAAQ